MCLLASLDVHSVLQKHFVFKGSSTWLSGLANTFYTEQTVYALNYNWCADFSFSKNLKEQMGRQTKSVREKLDPLRKSSQDEGQ